MDSSFFSLDSGLKRAIAYYRHSAEDKQENSVPIQQEHAAKFAAQHAIEIIHFEADEGKTGLLATRPGFERLFSDWILNPDAPPFEYVLVYDVSRWGRFQDQDEAAYYEFRCKQHGKKVIYITRGFPKEEQQLIAHLQTSIERYMAAEYSRQLSDKVFHGSRTISGQGFSVGGSAPYGMERVLLDESHNPIQVLKKGERKVIANQRVGFTPSEGDSAEVVRTMFHLLIDHWQTPEQIAEYLNSEGSRAPGGGDWTRQKVIARLTNETYAGSRIYNKTWGRLKQKKRNNPRSEWVIKEDAHEAIVDFEVFRKAQENLYWLITSKWKRGTYSINKVKRLIKGQIDALLDASEEYHPDVAWQIQRKFPVAFGITFYKEGVAHWCFVVTEELKKLDFILGIGVNLYTSNPIEQIFHLTTKDFGAANFLIVSEDSQSHTTYPLEVNVVQERVMELCEKLASMY